jgi:hypothetical protein
VTVCNKRKPGDIHRCSLERGHIGMHQTFDPDAVWTNERQQNREYLSRSPLKKTSDKQDQRTAFLHGIKAERMLRPVLVYGGEEAPRSWVCEGQCGRVWYDFGEAWKALTVSHIEARNDTASRYERRREPDFRGDDPSNILLECVPCNQAREPQSQFGSA